MLENPSDDPPSAPLTTPPEVLALMREQAATIQELLKKCAETRAKVERLVAERTTLRRRRRKSRRR